MLDKFETPKIRKILTLPADKDESWKADLQKFISGDVKLDRHTAGENSIKALQRLLIFLGYSTSFRGAYTIDGDFGRGTNRGLAQFKFEHNVRTNYDRNTLCYPCKASNAHRAITIIPDVKLTVATLQKIVAQVETAIQSGQLMCGSYTEALKHLNLTHSRQLFSCRTILDKYGQMASDAVDKIKIESGITIEKAWLLAIIKQETGGVVRPRFEQHLLTSFNKKHPNESLEELRLQATSFGLGQILGCNYKMVKAASAKAMFCSPLKDQVLHIGRFLIKRSKHTKAVVQKQKPKETDFRTLARYYNGPKYEEHRYHESIASWYKEFKALGA